VDAGLLDVLHDAGQVEVVTVVERVDVDLDGVLEEAVDEAPAPPARCGSSGRRSRRAMSSV
jgi:hypothetical protein